MTPLRTAGRRIAVSLAVLALGLTPLLLALAPSVALAQEVSADPKSITPAPTDLRAGFQLVPDKSEQREPVPGITVYEADFVRDQTPKNFADGPIEIKSLVAKTANSQQAAEQFASSRQALTTASPPWVETKVAKLGDESTGLSMEGTSSEGPAIAHLFLFRRGAMVVGITVAGLKKPTKMAEAEAIASAVWRKLEPSIASQTGPTTPRPLNTQRPPSNASGGSGAQTQPASTQAQPAGTGQRVRVANTGGTGLRLRTGPSRSAQIATVLPEGTMLDVIGPDAQGDGLTWKNVRAPGDGRGYVAADYVTTVASAAPTNTSSTANTSNTAAASTVPASNTTTTTANSQPASNTTAAAQPAPSPSTPANSTASSPANSAASTPASGIPGDVLKVDVSVKSNEVKAGGEQTATVTVTKDGQPVSGAQVTIKTSPTGDTPPAPATDDSGTTSVTWKPTGSDGFIGVGVSVLSSDGVAGVGGASFRLT